MHLNHSKDGSYTWCEVYGYSHYDESGSPVVMVSVDRAVGHEMEAAKAMEGRRNAEVQLDLARTAREAQEYFMRFIFHEVRALRTVCEMPSSPHRRAQVRVPLAAVFAGMDVLSQDLSSLPRLPAAVEDFEQHNTTLHSMFGP